MCATHDTARLETVLLTLNFFFPLVVFATDLRLMTCLRQEKAFAVAADFVISCWAGWQCAKRTSNNPLFQESEMQNETQTITDHRDSIIEDLTLNETAAAQVKGGVPIDAQGRLLIGTDQGIYRSGGAGAFTLTFNGQTTAPSAFGQPATFTATLQPF
jgi:hypothetical protein